MNEIILKVEDLHIYYYTLNGVIRAVNGVGFDLCKDEVFGIVGESGCGKSTLAMGVLQLVQPPGIIEKGRVLFNGRDLLQMNANDFRQVRWKEISYIPQGAMNSLNPVIRIREQFYDVIQDHGNRSTRKVNEEQIKRLLAGVHLPSHILNRFPHELSGGMKQRTCIAMAMVLQPKLIIADEPTSALDVVSQRVVLETLAEVRRNLGASMILIGHDLGLQAQIADRVGIMYAGNFVEIGTVDQIFNNPFHIYTQRLIASLPSIRKKQNVAELAKISLTEEEKSTFGSTVSLIEVEPDHFVANHISELG